VFIALCYAVAGWLFYSHFAREDFKVNKRPFSALGEFAADELAKIIPQGRVQVVYDVSNESADRTSSLSKALEMQEVQALAFKRRLAERGKFSFAPDTKLPRSPMAMRSAWPEGTFHTLTQMSDTTLVLFSSLPALNNPHRQSVQQRTGKLVVVGMASPEVQPAVDARLVHLAVAYRVPVPQNTKGTETPQEWVNRVYTVLTPERRAP
jgi:hypothetical protein